MAQSARFLALDVFRGMTVCFMIIVNTPGSWSYIYSPLEHAPWHGFTPTDLVFPSFLFAVGNAMAFVMHRYEAQGSGAFWRKTLKRTALIFIIGFLLSWFPFFDKMPDGSWSFIPLSETRILGVLGRIALCYFFASVILHYSSKKAVIAFCVFALFGYWIVMYAFGDANDPYSLVGNAALKLDLAVIGEKHMYHGEGIAFDPEGILSTLPAIVNVIIGFLAGDYIRRKGSNFETIAKLMVVGSALMFVAYCWDMFFPINKKIWTSSFVLLTTGIDLVVLAVLIYILDIVRYKKGSYFFEVFGRNPLFIYAMSGIIITIMFMIPVGESNLQRFFYADVFGSFAGPVFASFLFAIFYMMINWLIGFWLDKKRIYIKV
jgi:predicted acyltransferase